MSIGRLRTPLPGYTSNKLESLKKFILANNPSFLPPALCSSEKMDLTAYLGTEIFRRASEDYLRSKDLNELGEIAAKAALGFYSFCDNGKDSFHLEGRLNTNPRTGNVFASFFVVLVDRPFVVRSIVEAITLFTGLTIGTVLHPIIEQDNGKKYSVTYLEVEGVKDEATLNLLLAEFQQVLTEVVAATDDYTFMYERAIATANFLKNSQHIGSFSSLEKHESSEFLHWLTQKGFIFLGFQEWVGENPKNVEPLAETSLGLFRPGKCRALKQILDSIAIDIEYVVDNTLMTGLTKLPQRSVVKRRNYLDTVILNLPGAPGQKTRIQAFVGLFTTDSYKSSLFTIPFARQKMQEVVEIEHTVPNSHDYNEIVNLTGSIPLASILWLTPQELASDISMILSLQRRRRTLLTIHSDPLQRFMIVVVVMPRDRYSETVKDNIQAFLEKTLKIPAGSGEAFVASSDAARMRVHYLLPVIDDSYLSIDKDQLQTEVAMITFTWDDQLRHNLTGGDRSSPEMITAARYSAILCETYKTSTSPAEAAKDISFLRRLSETSPVMLRINKKTGDAGSYDLRIYKNNGKYSLSTIVPVLENAGFEVLSEDSTSVCNDSGLNAEIYSVEILPRTGQQITDSLAENILLPALIRVLSGSFENTPLNALLLNPGMSWKQIAILRTIKEYLIQIKAVPSAASVIDALTLNPTPAKTLVEYFEARFNPQAYSDFEERQVAAEALRERFTSELREVKRIIEDKILRSILNVLRATVRTNYYLLSESDFRVALKINSGDIEAMPEPRPYFEIFVSSSEFAGVHLRGGAVARGGLRWSERPEDFRTEILGLMKTQVVKNSIIIPSGAKGGFVVKKFPADSSLTFETVKAVYKKFITSLLEMTDNRAADGTVCPPENVVRWDNDDPYLVVAADKGTATFSDTANGISVDGFDFWLGDAFASGGSQGYDHKKLGITAKGAWEAVSRHFREMGVDVANESVTSVGIGDMSGDVFGNGLLLSRHLKLLAAFNHKHIFLDPDPDPAVSFAERERMFALPKSSWSDYNADLISTGGGIFERATKEIPISPETQKALGISSSVLSGEQLIKAILSAPVDLLWNGGIGTYVKASTERNSDVGDKTNDEVRINAGQLRAKVVGEGGNLGFTQKARIEFANLGGHINTDAIDNSGGVDLSDREVNIKILLQQAVRSGSITIEERNILLAGYANGACDKILQRNRSQSLSLALEEVRSKENPSAFAELILILEERAALTREQACLPTAEELEKRISRQQGFSRPELATLLSHSKLLAKSLILASNLPEEEIVKPLFYSYFPEWILNRFPSEVESHPLRREITATQLANICVEMMGATFLTQCRAETSAAPSEVISSFWVAYCLFEQTGVIEQLQQMDKAKSALSYIKTLIFLSKGIDSITKWLLNNKNGRSWSELHENSRKPFTVLIGNGDNYLAEEEKGRYRARYNRLSGYGVTEETLPLVASIPYATGIMDVIDIAASIKADELDVARIYNRLADAIMLTRLLQHSKTIASENPWEKRAMQELVTTFKSSTRDLTRAATSNIDQGWQGAIDIFLEQKNEKLHRFSRTLQKVLAEPPQLAALFVLGSELNKLRD
ncbi:MAG: NAD-glutamate dehydrogenase [bacterium]|nr:NAD-glutamate dehydrogenase [bacterium]